MEHRMLGIACVVGAVTIFVLQDALIKWLSGGYPLHEIVLVRAVSAVSVTLVVMRLEGGIHLLRTRRLGLHLARAGLLIIANSAVCLALAAMTIAEAVDLWGGPRCSRAAGRRRAGPGSSAGSMRRSCRFDWRPRRSPGCRPSADPGRSGSGCRDPVRRASRARRPKASDAFFPFRDGIDAAAEAGVSAVIEPGGSMRDDEVVAAADEHGMAMVFTRMRHFRH